MNEFKAASTGLTLLRRINRQGRKIFRYRLAVLLLIRSYALCLLSRAVVIGYGQVGQLIAGHMYIALRSDLRQMLIALLNRLFGFWRYLAVVIVYLVYEIIAVLFLLLDILIVSFLKRSCRSSDSV